MPPDADHVAVTENTAPEQDSRIQAARERAARAAAALDMRLLAAQVIVSGIDGKGHLSPDMRALLAECPAGGIMLFRYNLDTPGEEIQNLITEISALISGQIAGGIAPFIAVDHEGGSVLRFRPGVADLPPAGTYWERGDSGAIARIEEDSFRAGTEIGRLGINLNLAPVAEPLSAANSEFLGDRSYGPSADFTAEAASAFIRGMERAGLLCAVKHFPGSAGRDPHRFVSVMNDGPQTLAELTSPFTALVRKRQCRALMAAHTLVPARDSENIASLSAKILNGWLREEIGFDGILICDDFSMAAAQAAGDGKGEAVVLSLAAGADMALVWPSDLRATHAAIQAAVADGRLSEERLREAAARIIFEKIQMGLIDDEQ